MDTATLIRVVSGVLALAALTVIVYRRKQKSI